MAPLLIKNPLLNKCPLSPPYPQPLLTRHWMLIRGKWIIDYSRRPLIMYGWSTVLSYYRMFYGKGEKRKPLWKIRLKDFQSHSLFHSWQRFVGYFLLFTVLSDPLCSVVWKYDKIVALQSWWIHLFVFLFIFAACSQDRSHAVEVRFARVSILSSLMLACKVEGEFNTRSLITYAL